jgi:hypothetical protein
MVAFLHSIFGTSRARSMSASGIVCVPCAGLDHDGAVGTALQDAFHAADVRDGIGETKLGPPRPRTLEVRLLAQRAIEPGRRHLEPLEVDVLDGEQPGELAGDPRAVLDADALSACR